MVESRGDYRAEAYLEDHIGGKLYSQQHSLPRLPIPNISDTMTKLVPTVLPLAKSDEEKATFIKACEDFEGQAGELQRRLVERKEGDMKDSSWLQHWWNTMGYLQVRLHFFRESTVMLLCRKLVRFRILRTERHFIRFEIPW